MTPPDMSPQELERAAAIYALKRLPPDMRSEFLSDPEFTRIIGFDAVPSLTLGATTLPRAEVLGQFRKIFAQSDAGAENKGEARIDHQSGDGLFDHDGHTYRLSYIDLLQPDRDRRMKAWGKLGVNFALSSRQYREIESLLVDPISDETFISISMMLDRSADRLRTSLSENFARGGLNERDLVTGNTGYWESLLPAPEQDDTKHYIGTVLQTEFLSRLSCNSDAACRWLGMLMGVPAFAEATWIASLDTGLIDNAITSIQGTVDPFASAGALRLVTKETESVPAWEETGKALITSGFSDVTQLDAACHVFSSAFLVTTGFLSQHVDLRNRPVFWRRMAATIHSNLVVRACGTNIRYHRSLWEWARSLAGVPYLLGALAEFAVETRWRPEWIDPGFVLADLAGHIRGATMQLPNHQAPDTWKPEIDAINRHLELEGTSIQSYLPGPTQGSGTPPMSSLADYSEMAEFFIALRKRPTVANLARLGPLIQTFGVPVEVVPDICKTLRRFRNSAGDIDHREAQTAMIVAAHVAALLRNVEVGQAVADTVLSKARYLQSNYAILEATARLVECSTAFIAEHEHLVLLGKWLEQMAFALNKPSKLRYFKTLLAELEELGPSFRQSLGRASAISALGAIGLR